MDYARLHSFVIVSKDSDFQTRSQLLGASPKGIWVRLGNCTRTAVEKLLRDYSTAIHKFERDETQAILLLPLQQKL